MTERRKKILRRTLVVLPVLAAVSAAVYLVSHKPGPAQKPEEEAVRTLRIIKAPSVDLVPRAAGYGVAEPGQVWDAVAEVKGTVVSIHPRLKSGERIAAKSILIRIDPTEYELAIARLEAGVEETRAKIKELAGDKENLRRLLAVEQRSLELARKSLERKRTALKRNALSQDEADREERDFLRQKQTVGQLENSLSLMPSKQNALTAALNVHQANLKQAKIDLAKTTITAPFDCRLAEVGIEVGQFVRTGQSLFNAHGTAVTEVEARFRMETLRDLLGKEARSRLQPGLDVGAIKELFEDFNARVILQNGDWSAQWEARIDRFRESVDPKTREMKVVIAVDRPYEKAQPGVRPPLTAGMFCRVELSAPVRPGSVVVPRSALHGDRVFVVDREDRLQQIQVAADFTQADFVVIRSGLSGGERVVVSDPTPAIIGMKVAPVADDDLRQHLLASSQGATVRQ